MYHALEATLEDLHHANFDAFGRWEEHMYEFQFGKGSMDPKAPTLTGERFPEYDEWMATEKKEKEEHWKKVKELEGDPKGLLVFALEKLTGKKTADLPKAKPPLPPVSRLGLPQPATKQKVGRNDPCPCRSGKKFKNCCMRK